jgi:CRP-like cAMP-binding protein
MIEIMSLDLNVLMHRLPATDRQFAAGAHIFRQGAKVLVLHQIVDGSAHLVRHQSNGAVLVLQRAGPASILAEASMFSERYHCDAVAVAATQTRAIAKPVLRAALARDLDLAEAWAAYLAREVQATRMRAEILSLRTVAERLDSWIAARSKGLPGKGEWRSLAADIGVSPEALYRELARRRARRASARPVRSPR